MMGLAGDFAAIDQCHHGRDGRETQGKVRYYIFSRPKRSHLFHFHPDSVEQFSPSTEFEPFERPTHPAIATSERVNSFSLEFADLVLFLGAGEAEFGSAGTQSTEE